MGVEQAKKQEIKRKIPMVERMPKDEENKHLSKEQFQAKMRAKRELDAKLKAYENDLRSKSIIAEQEEVVTENVTISAPKEDNVYKGRGRPKKIE